MHKTRRSSKDHHSRQAASHAHRSSRSRSRSISQSDANSTSASKAQASTKQTFRTYNKVITNKQFDPLLPSRVFVGPLDPRPGIVDEDQLFDYFVRYGRITGTHFVLFLILLLSWLVVLGCFILNIFIIPSVETSL